MGRTNKQKENTMDYESWRRLGAERRVPQNALGNHGVLDWRGGNFPYGAFK